MNLASEAEAAIETAVPAVRAARWAVHAAIGLLAAAAIAFVLWWLLIRPRAAQVQAATARVEAATATGTAGASQDAMKVTLDVLQHRAAIDVTTQENDRAIHAAAGAGDPIGADLARAGRAALCLRDAYQSDPECIAMRGAGEGVGPALPDAGSITPAH